MRPLADGTSYAAVSDDGRRIEVFSYKTGKAISTLFSLDAVKGDLRIDDFDGYALSENEEKFCFGIIRSRSTAILSQPSIMCMIFYARH